MAASSMDRQQQTSTTGQGIQTAADRVGLPGNPAQGRRAAIAAGATPNLPNMPLPNTLASMPPIPPIPQDVRKMPSTTGLTAPQPMSPSQVIALVREATKKALEENKDQAAEVGGLSNEHKPGVTVDLTHKNIQKLPEEVVDIIKDKLERIALSHNNISSLPARMAECTSLRYLNVRNNKMREFPLPLCELKCLEIVDLGRNQLRSLPPDIVKMTSLKVLAIQKNLIKELPLCLADMSSLQMVKLDHNPLVFPPKEILQVQSGSPPYEGYLKDTELREVTITIAVRKFLKQHAQNQQIEAEAAAAAASGEESPEGSDTPRMPLIKRAASGRFPIKVAGADKLDARSPIMPRPPPIPTRSHYRGLSQQNTAIRRPGVMPLTIGNANERLRSNSETLLQATRSQQPIERQRRLAVVSRKAQDLGTLDETDASHRFSHYRGLSHGSAMQPNVGNGEADNKSPASPAELALQRPIYVRRLSVLPERRRESAYIDPVLEAAKGILYSVFQIHPMIQMLMSLTNDGTARRSSLEIVFYNTNIHVEQLEQEIQRHDAPVHAEEDYGPRDNENVQRACVTLVDAYAHVCSSLASNVDLFINNGDPRYIRTLLMLLYNSTMELRVTASQYKPNVALQRANSKSALDHTIRPYSRAPASTSTTTPTLENPGHMPRSSSRNFVHNPSNLRVATDVNSLQVSVPYLNGTGRTATITSTPRSGESFASLVSLSSSLADFSDDDHVFESVFLSLQKSTDLVLRTLPNMNSQFTICLRNAMQQRVPKAIVWWKKLVAKCNTAIKQTELLKDRLSGIKLKEPGVRSQSAFWELCRLFVDSWAELGRLIKDISTSVPEVQLPLDTKSRLRPIQLSVKETNETILASPWSYLLRSSHSATLSLASPLGSGILSPVGTANTAVTTPNGHTPSSSTTSQPMSSSFNAAFHGGVFERADALMKMGGVSMSSSNGGTTPSLSRSATNMSSSTNHSSNLSFSSTISSSGEDELVTPSGTGHPVFSPNGHGYGGYGSGHGSGGGGGGGAYNGNNGSTTSLVSNGGGMSMGYRMNGGGKPSY